MFVGYWKKPWTDMYVCLTCLCSISLEFCWWMAIDGQRSNCVPVTFIQPPRLDLQRGVAASCTLILSLFLSPRIHDNELGGKFKKNVCSVIHYVTDPRRWLVALTLAVARRHMWTSCREYRRIPIGFRDRRNGRIRVTDSYTGLSQ